MKCPKCHSENFVKDGIVKGKQRFLCKECKYRYTVEFIGKSPEMKRKALHLYLEGLGFRSIGRIIEVSNVTVLYWIKSFGKEIEELQKEEKQIEVIELDELHTYIKSKKTIAGFGLLLIGMGKDSSISCLAQEGLKQEWFSGKR
jgi:transposase